MSEASPLVPSPASVSVQEAFDLYYAGLVADLTPLSGSPAAAEAAVDEAFRQAAAQDDFAEIGRRREWLLAMARNHVVRKPFRQYELGGDGSGQASGGFERPTLAATLARARGAHRGQRLRTTGVAAAGVAVAIALAVAAPQLNPLRPDTNQPAAAPPTSTSTPHSFPPIFPTTTPSPTPTPEPWPPPLSDIVGGKGSVRAYTMASADTPGTIATIWKRCRPEPPSDEPPCQFTNAAQAVDVTDGKGHHAAFPLAPEESVRPAFNGTFAIISSGAENAHLIGVTMKEPKPFTVRFGAKPTRGQVFSECSSGPCLVDLHGTVTHVAVPPNVQWYWDTTEGWVGSSAMSAPGQPMTAYIQQQNGAFASVDMVAKISHGTDGIGFSMETRPHGVVLLYMYADFGVGQVAVSTDRGRTWQFRWPSTNGAPAPADWRDLTVASPPMFTVSPLKPVD